MEGMNPSYSIYLMLYPFSWKEQDWFAYIQVIFEGWAVIYVLTFHSTFDAPYFFEISISFSNALYLNGQCN